MRLFTAISPPEATLYSLECFLAPLRPLASIRWSPAAHLHITTKFIGECPPERLPEIRAALDSLSSPVFDISLGGLGWFPSSQSPHVFWMGVAGGDALIDLAARTATVLQGLGWPRDERPFSPHLTLARTRRESRLGSLRRALDSIELPTFPPFAVADFYLYQSDAGTYRKLHSFNLAITAPRKIE